MNTSLINLSNDSRYPHSNSMMSGSLASGRVRWILLGLSGIIVAIEMFSFTAMRRTVRIPNAVRFLSCGLLLVDAFMIVFFASRYYCEYQQASVILTASLHECGRVCLVITWFLIAVMGLERVTCLFQFDMYVKHSSKMKIGTVASTGCMILIKLTLRYIVLPLSEGKSFDLVTLTFQPGYMHWILGACLIVTIVCFVAVLSVMRNKTTGAPAKLSPGVSEHPRWPCTKSVLIFVCLFVVTHFPVFAIKVFWHKQNDAQVVWRTSIISVGLLMSLMHPALFVWRFRECRYIMKKMLSTFLPCVNRTKLEQSRLQIYDIVTYNKNG